MRVGPGFIAAAVLAAVGVASAAQLSEAHAQAIDLSADADGQAIEIEADGGLEWREAYSMVTASGNARATRGDVEVRASALNAFYREGAGGNSEVWRLEAVGDVLISSEDRAAYADRGTYDVDNAVLVLSGDDGVRLVSPDGEITAEDQLEYWEKKHMVVARGNAQARQGDRGLSADVLVAYFKTGENGETGIERVEAFDDVYVYTKDEKARAQRGVYNVTDNMATLTGSVRITRGENQLNGCRAEVNLQSGVSKLFGCGGGSSGSQVKGLIHPDERNGK